MCSLDFGRPLGLPLTPGLKARALPFFKALLGTVRRFTFGSRLTIISFFLRMKTSIGDSFAEGSEFSKFPLKISSAGKEIQNPALEAVVAVMSAAPTSSAAVDRKEG